MCNIYQLVQDFETTHGRFYYAWWIPNYDSYRGIISLFLLIPNDISHIFPRHFRCIYHVFSIFSHKILICWYIFLGFYQVFPCIFPYFPRFPRSFPTRRHPPRLTKNPPGHRSIGGSVGDLSSGGAQRHLARAKRARWCPRLWTGKHRKTLRKPWKPKCRP